MITESLLKDGAVGGETVVLGAEYLQFFKYHINLIHIVELLPSFLIAESLLKDGAVGGETVVLGAE